MTLGTWLWERRWSIGVLAVLVVIVKPSVLKGYFLLSVLYFFAYSQTALVIFLVLILTFQPGILGFVLTAVASALVDAALRAIVEKRLSGVIGKLVAGKDFTDALAADAQGHLGNVALLASDSKPSWGDMFRIVLAKHLLVAWQRKRYLASVLAGVLGNSVAFLWLILFRRIARDSQEKGETEWMGLYYAVAAFAPVYFCIPMVLGASAPATTDIVEEKETKMKVLQAIYGFPPALYWLTWTAYFALVTILGTFMSVALSFSWYLNVFEKSSSLLIMLVFLLGYAQQIAGACCLAVVLDRSQSSFMIASMVGAASQAVGLFVNSYSLGIFGNGWTPYLLTWTLPGVSTYSALADALWNECAENGVTWDNWDEAIISIYDHPITFIPMRDLVTIQFFSLLFYVFLAWYLDQVWPSEFGTPRPLGFLLQPGYWKQQATEAASVQSGAEKDAKALEISDLVKAFGKKLAVDHVHLSVEKGEVFALLGHNGAGKTTVFNCITGLYAPTKGEVRIAGRSVSRDLEESRRQFAVCPQDSPLYPEFTVERHLYFFGTLMGRQNLAGAVAEVLNAVGLQHKRLHLGDQLSGGQQRRLWVATALLGARPLSLLDEPTSGMDPVSRRDLWTLILQMRAEGRSTMFTTHYLDEADYLANRKAVLAHGQVRAVGTSHELKIRFGVGYHLRLEKAPSASETSRAALKALVEQHMPCARMEQDTKAFVFPYTELALIGPLLTALEEQSAELGVSNYDVQMTSLEDVFMELGRQADAEVEGGNASGGSSSSSGNCSSGSGSSSSSCAAHQQEAGAVSPPGPEERAVVGLWAAACALRRIRAAAFCSHRVTMARQLALPIILIYLAFRPRDKLKGESDEYDPAEATFSHSLLLTAFAIASAGVTGTIVKDTRNKCKHVAVAQGLSHKAFWLGTFMAHYLQLLLPALAVPFFMNKCKCRIMDMEGGPALVFQECLVYPVGVLLVAYHVTFASTSAEAAAKYLPLAILSLDVLQSNILTMLGREFEAYHFLLSMATACVNPLNSLPGTLFLLDHMQKSRFAHPLNGTASGNEALFGKTVSEWSDPRQTYTALPLKWGLCGTYPLLAALLLLRERWVPEPAEAAEDSYAICNDEEVCREERRLRRLAAADSPGSLNDVAVAVNGLMHSYATARGNVEAVRGISFGIEPGECFGLLGPNGAGKTTTLAALTGEVKKPSAGQLYMLGHEVTVGNRPEEVRRHLGFCPQIDPLWDEVTGRHHLLFYGLIKGIPAASLPKQVDAVLARLGFEPSDADKLTGTYSGGMRRKLSIAIAIIGRPKVLLLDEPTTAVDAVGKRHLWAVLQGRGADQCTLLLTHSMEEAEVLCGRIAIQVQGRLRCLGSAARLKARYGAGLLLEVMLGDAEDREGAVTKLVRTVHQVFSPEVLLMEQQIDRCLFRLPPVRPDGSKITTGQVFLELGKRKDELSLASYGTSQQTLEQLFLRFAQEREGESTGCSAPSGC